jgi:hypothetical protein
MDSQRLIFQELYSSLLEVKWGLHPQVTKLQGELNALILTEAKKLRSRIKTEKSAIEVLGNKRVAELQAPFSAEVKRLCDEQATSIKQLEERLRSLATEIELKNSSQQTIFYESSTHAYASQGFGAVRYAEGKAILESLKPAHYGIKYEIEKQHLSYCRQYGVESAIFKVVVQLEELDTLVLKFKPEATLKEFVSGCWKRGLNPRVYYPLLPHGFEEEMGISHF